MHFHKIYFEERILNLYKKILNTNIIKKPQFISLNYSSILNFNFINHFHNFFRSRENYIIQRFIDRKIID